VEERRFIILNGPNMNKEKTFAKNEKYGCQFAHLILKWKEIWLKE
jgi:hypothetical protein